MRCVLGLAAASAVPVTTGCVSSTTYRDPTPETIDRLPVRMQLESGEVHEFESPYTRLELADAPEGEWVRLDEYLASNVKADVTAVRRYRTNTCAVDGFLYAGGISALASAAVGGGALLAASDEQTAWRGTIAFTGALFSAVIGGTIGGTAGAFANRHHCAEEHDAEILGFDERTGETAEASRSR